MQRDNSHLILRRLSGAGNPRLLYLPTRLHVIWPRSKDRVGPGGLRPLTLPHHRTCGSASGGWYRDGFYPVRAVALTTIISCFACLCRLAAWSPALPSPECLHGFTVGHLGFVQRPADSVRLGLLTFGLLVAVSIDKRLASQTTLRSFALPCFRMASSLLRPLLTPCPLSRTRSPWVRTCTFPARRQPLPSAS